MRKYYEPPDNEDAFERLCVALMRRVLINDHLCLHGRRGQGQGGLDIVDPSGRLPSWGGQCKLRNSRRELAVADISRDVRKLIAAGTNLDRFCVLTTARNSVRAQVAIEALNQTIQAAGNLTVQVVFWDELVSYLNEHEDVASQFYGGASGSSIREVKTQVAGLRVLGVCALLAAAVLAGVVLWRVRAEGMEAAHGRVQIIGRLSQIAESMPSVLESDGDFALGRSADRKESPISDETRRQIEAFKEQTLTSAAPGVVDEGLLQFASGEYVAAAALFGQALRDAGQNRSMIYNFRGQALLAASKYAEAVNAFERGLECVIEATPSATIISLRFGLARALDDWADTSPGDGSAERRERAREGWRGLLELQHLTELQRGKVLSNYALTLLRCIESAELDERPVMYQEMITAGEEALRHLSGQSEPEYAGIVHSNLGVAYRGRGDLGVEADRKSDLVLAEMHLKAALDIWEALKLPERWAMSAHNLSAVFTQRAGMVTGGADRQALLARAVELSDSVSSLHAGSRDEVSWAKARINGAISRVSYARGCSPPEQLCESLQAIDAINEALDILTEQVHPWEWANALNSRGSALFQVSRSAPRADAVSALVGAAICFRTALPVQKKNGWTREWAQAQVNLSNALLYLGNVIENEAGIAFVAEAAARAEEASMVQSLELDPARWAQTQDVLMAATNWLGERAKGTERAANLERAAEAARSAAVAYGQVGNFEEQAKRTRTAEGLQASISALLTAESATGQ
jgi:tetratricopeptide (TPR) repeat protein